MQTIVTLSNGTEVKCSPVSVYMAIDIQRAQGIIEPEKPMQEIVTVTGHVEKVSFAEDSDDPTWTSYLSSLEEFHAEEERFSRGFMWDTGVISWKFPDTDVWETQPPEEWEMPPIIARTKMYSDCVDARRVSYIKYDLLVNTADANKVAQVLYGTALLSSNEVDAAVNSFQD